jgi:predicted nuclease of predicted toxin-antitoxin system
MVVKGEPVLLDDRTDTIINPLASVEVLSKSTKNYDQSEDTHIFDAAKAAGDVILMTKDRDFIELVERYGSPPHVIWLTCGNTSNDRLKEIMTATLPNAIELLRLGESVVEITGN